jgi:photosynthetic reaction center cytochrome c subunit
VTASRTSRRVVLAFALAPLALAACEGGAKDTQQWGYRGNGREQVADRSQSQAVLASHQAPAPLPPAGPSPAGPAPWQNVQVLTDVSVGEFNRTMIAMSQWVAGGAGNCAYCHVAGNLASDSLYTKRVARRMLQMNRDINANYANHVQATGVTCYTCHRGNAQPNGYWFFSDENQYLRYYLDRPDVRVQSQTVEPTSANRSSIKQTEWTYAVMIAQTKALGVNCTFCHNSRAWASWEQSGPKRVIALYGSQMVRHVNSEYLAPLKPEYPASHLTFLATRVGQVNKLGDAPKLQCITCHNGLNRPINGAQMARDYPALWGSAAWDSAGRVQQFQQAVGDDRYPRTVPPPAPMPAAGGTRASASPGPTPGVVAASAPR